MNSEMFCYLLDLSAAMQFKARELRNMHLTLLASQFGFILVLIYAFIYIKPT